MFWLRRIFQRIFLLILLTLFCYLLMDFMPGDPLDLMIQSNPQITSQDIIRLKQLYGMDQPVLVRFSRWATDIAQGNLGYSSTYRIPVAELIGPKLFNTFILSMATLAAAILLAIPLGIWAALKPRSRTDYLINLFSFAGLSMPSFFLGLVLILFFAVQLKILPAGGTLSLDYSQLSAWEQIKDRGMYLVLPLLSLSLQQIGVLVRYTRAAFLEVLKQDFIRTARAKGLSRFKVLSRHAFRNALLPIITILVVSFSQIFSGATVTEFIFAYQGVGKLVYDSILANDFNVAMISFLISVAMVLFFNLLADFLYAWADPRIEY